MYVRRVLKKQIDTLFLGLGVNMFSESNAFPRWMSPQESIASDLKLNKPNKLTLASMLEAERIAKDPNVKGYSTTDELFSALDK